MLHVLTKTKPLYGNIATKSSRCDLKDVCTLFKITTVFLNISWSLERRDRRGSKQEHPWSHHFCRAAPDGV